MKNSPIQWCDDTANPVMGCDGCELWPEVGQILSALVNLIYRFYPSGRSEIRKHVSKLVAPFETATELYHTRAELVENLGLIFPAVPEDDLNEAIADLFRCYAGILHLYRGARPEDWKTPLNTGHAAIFEQPVKFSGRMTKSAALKDLRGTPRHGKPWLNIRRRLIFVSDMGDALSDSIDFEYLKTEIIDTVASPKGRHHTWLWLTKRPKRMAEFAEWLIAEHGLAWPPNLVAMTSVTNRATRSRIDDLRSVPAKLRGLSVEPLIESVDLDLRGIDWVIVGGESGGYPREFDLGWARSLQAQCREAGVAFFMKQLGANAVEDRFPIPQSDSHGGDWSDWPEDLRVREFPAAFQSITPA